MWSKDISTSIGGLWDWARQTGRQTEGHRVIKASNTKKLNYISSSQSKAISCLRLYSGKNVHSEGGRERREKKCSAQALMWRQFRKKNCFNRLMRKYKYFSCRRIRLLEKVLLVQLENRNGRNRLRFVGRTPTEDKPSCSPATTDPQ